HGFPSSHRPVPSSIWPSQLLSLPSQISAAPVPTFSVAVALTDTAFTATAVAGLTNAGAPHVYEAVLSISTGTALPCPMRGRLIERGLVATTVQVAAGSVEVTCTVMPVRAAGNALSEITTPLAVAPPVLVTVIVWAIGAAVFAGATAGLTDFVIPSVV